MQPITGRIDVLTFKEGILSKVAHDLSLRVGSFELATDGERVEGKFRLTSLGVEGVMNRGVLDSHGVSEGDRREIEGNIQNKILRTKEYPEATFSGRARKGEGRHALSGTLTLAGKARDIELEVREADGHWRGEVELVPSRWGIQPYKALLGAIKLQDRVVVRFDCAVI